MKLLNATPLLSAIAIAGMFASPASAQQSRHHVSHPQRMMSDPAPDVGRGLYNMAPDGGHASDSSAPDNTGGGSVGYNRNLRDDMW